MAARTLPASLLDLVGSTPIVELPRLSPKAGVRVFVKLENLQMTGSFKERGAANVLLQLSPAERKRGVVTASAGNHGLAVAFHAARLGSEERRVGKECVRLCRSRWSRTAAQIGRAHV